MTLTAAAIRAMAEKGLSASDIADIAEAMLVRADPTAAERKRRQRNREKEEKEMSQRDVTRDMVPPNESILTPSSTDYPDEASASSPLRQPIGDAQSVWNEAAAVVGWPTVKTLSPNRQKQLGSRLRQYGLDGWTAAVARASASPYLAGADPPSWFTFDWLIKAGNFLKLIEGNYDRNRTSNSPTDRPSAWGAARDFVRVHP